MTEEATPLTKKIANPRRPLRIKTVYAFFPGTGEYVGEEVSRESPMDVGEFMTPLHTTVDAPPEAPEGQAAVYKDGLWSLVPDLRGTVVYDIGTGAASAVQNLGAIPAGYVQTAPTAHGQKYNGSEWVSPATNADTWDGKSWVTNMPALRRVKLGAVQQKAVKDAQALAAGYIAAEVATWPQQLAEAQLLIGAGGVSVSTPLLEALAAARSIDKMALAKSVVAKNTAYSKALAAVLAAQRTAEAAVTGATTADALKAL